MSIESTQEPTRVEKLFGRRKDRRGIDWNDERVETLKRMRAAGYSARQTAIEIGCSRGAVLGKAKRLGLAVPTKSSITRQQRIAEPVALQRRPQMDDRQEPLGCRYIEKDPKEPDWEFCQRTKPRGSSFCPFHHDIVWHKAVWKPGKHDKRQFNGRRSLMAMGSGGRYKKPTVD